MRAETPLCWWEKTKETTSRHGSEGSSTEGCLLQYIPVSGEYQCGCGFGFWVVCFSVTWHLERLVEAFAIDFERESSITRNVLFLYK